MSLETVERQDEDQCQKLHLTEINLTIERQLVMDLKAKLQKTREAAQLAKEAVKVEKKASYLLAWKRRRLSLPTSSQKYAGITMTRHGIRPLAL